VERHQAKKLPGLAVGGNHLCRYVIRPFVKSYGDSSSETLSPFMILMRFRRSLPAIVARTVFPKPKSSSMENIPALNFSTTLPMTSIASSFGKFFLYLCGIERGCGTFGTAPRFKSRLYQRLCREPPPFPRFPPPPGARSPFGRASLTFSALPSTSLPFRPLIAAFPSASALISTNAKPLACPVSRSVTMFTRSTEPYDSNMERTVFSVVPKLRLPTKIFFNLTSF
jgi:hypothetical protein